MRLRILFISLLSFYFSQSFAQSGINRFLTPCDTLNKVRVYTVGNVWVGVYFGTLVGLNQLWYANYPRSSFHFFNDNGEWEQIDKVGHTYTAYFEAEWSTAAFKWSGVNDKTAAWLGGATGLTLQSTIEILDGFSSKWGFSVGDMTANALGSGICVAQNLLWNEQRMQLKFSSHYVDYTAYPGYNVQMQQRAGDLFGTSFAEHVIKDYNGQTYWLSVNPYSFMDAGSRFPKWLNIAVGYGAEGMLGGFDNSWYDANDLLITRYDVPRYRQFFLSPDISFSHIHTNSYLLKMIFGVMDVIKVPAPALEINTQGKLKLYPVYF